MVLPTRAQTPITLSATGHNITPGRVYNWQRLRTTAATLPQLVAGPNQTWDLRALPLQGAPTSFTWLAPTANPAYPQATVASRYGVAFGPLTIQGESYLGYEAAGYVQYGSALTAQRFSLGPISGNNADSLSFPAQSMAFVPPLVQQELPSTYGTSSLQFHRTVTQARITVNAFNLTNAPVQYVQRYTHTDSVIAWGTVQVPVAGLPSGSAPIPVLLHRFYTVEQDSFYVNGAPAQPALLAALNLTQGVTSTTVGDLLQRADSPQPVVSFNYSRPDRSQGTVAVSSENTLPLGLRTAATDALTVWPNPVSAGGIVRVEADGLRTAATATVHDALGRLVLTTILRPDGALHLPAILAPGAYLLTVRASPNQVSRHRLTVR